MSGRRGSDVSHHGPCNLTANGEAEPGPAIRGFCRFLSLLKWKKQSAHSSGGQPKARVAHSNAEEASLDSVESAERVHGHAHNPSGRSKLRGVRDEICYDLRHPRGVHSRRRRQVPHTEAHVESFNLLRIARVEKAHGPALLNDVSPESRGDAGDLNSEPRNYDEGIGRLPTVVAAGNETLRVDCLPLVRARRAALHDGGRCRSGTVPGINDAGLEPELAGFVVSSQSESVIYEGEDLGGTGGYDLLPAPSKRDTPDNTDSATKAF